VDTFQAHYADIRDPGQVQAVAARLRADGLVTFDGISSRYELPALAEAFMAIRLHRDSGPGGVTVITDTGSRSPGYAAFTDRELTPHTDGAADADPPGLLLLACLQPGRIGGSTIAADGAKVTAALAACGPAAVTALSAADAALFARGSSEGTWRPVLAPAGPGQCRIRFRSDDLASFSAAARAALPVLDASISQHLETITLQAGQGVMLSNTRWLHGRTRYTGDRLMLRVQGDPLPWTGIQPGFPVPALVWQNCSGTVAVAGAA
jgi:alpha-ketoglutarate-dependent taurine dioxygenase